MLASTLIYAQDLKPEMAKPIENTVPAPGSKVAATAAVAPVPKMKFEVVETATQVTASPLTRDERSASADKNANGVLSAAQMKTLSGKAERPKQVAPVSDDNSAKPLPIAAPVILKVQENK